jgi:large subunit ribosomal protein L25
MVKRIQLDAESRLEASDKAKTLLLKGYVPAVLYGAKTDNRVLKVKKRDFEHVFAEVGETHLVDLVIDGNDNARVIIKDIQRDPNKSSIIHVDFYQVDMKKKIEVQVPLHFINEAPAIRELGGTLVKNIDILDIKCLPGDLIDKIDIDISVLKTFEDEIKVSDIKLPADIEIMNDPREMIVQVMPVQEEKEPEVAAPVAETEAKTAESKPEEKTKS